MKDIRCYLKDNKLITDGAFGTYYAGLYDTRELPEKSNIDNKDRVIRVHKEYIDAGAKLIRTNTFASNTINLDTDIDGVRSNIRAAIANAKEAVAQSGREVYIAADIGPIPNDNMFDKQVVEDEYVQIVKAFGEEKTEVYVFETFSDLSNIIPAINAVPDGAFVIVQFAISQFGYSNSGLSARKLISAADGIERIDAVGFNCGIGPAHMEQFVERERKYTDKFFTALPNAGYPNIVSGRMVFSDRNVEYYSQKVCDIIKAGADIAGGCCGTTPDYIRRISQLSESLDKLTVNSDKTYGEDEKKSVTDSAFYSGKDGKKLIAVELAPPFDSNADKLMDAAHYLKEKGVDVLTFPDSPSGRTRADSILIAAKVSRQTGMCVMPHLCCRDKNAIAIRSQLLGAHINDINNFLVITGDPIPQMIRSSVKSVFNFDSVGLMNIIDDMNEEQFTSEPVTYGGAINQGRKRLDIEIGRVKKKMAAGATFFMTQPVFSDEDIERIHTIKKETGARILCGIMPLVSLKNATFMKNEMAGIDVTDEVLSRYRADMTKKEGEEAGIKLAVDVIEKTKDVADGYYFSFPFNRVHMLEDILRLSGLNA